MKSCRAPSFCFAVLGCLLMPALFHVCHARQIPASVNALLNKYGIPSDAVSIEVRHAETDKKILSLNSGIPRNPASVIKLLTTLSALEILGPNFQWKTRYHADGEIQDKVLKGDLIMQGGGDPFLTVERFWRHILAIRQRGIRTITGSLVIDNSYFDIPDHDRGAFDGQSARLYNVGPDAALVNFSSTRFVIHPVGGKIAVFADPPLTDLVIENNLEAQTGKCANRNSGWSYSLKRQGEKLIARFNGTYRSRCGQVAISRSVFSNNEYTFRLFKQLWNTSGGVFDGGYRIADTPEASTQIVDYPSEPLADIITGINKFSNNVMARQLFLSIRSDADPPDAPVSGSLDRSRQRVNEWLAGHGISMPELHIDNGSGLSRSSRITAAGLADLLRHGWKSNYRPEFLSSLPLSSIDGTMRKRLRDAGLNGRARIKTGFINGVRSMAGYVNSKNSRRYIVLMMIESKKVSYRSGNQIQDALLKWVYNL